VQESEPWALAKTKAATTTATNNNQQQQQTTTTNNNNKRAILVSNERGGRGTNWYEQEQSDPTGWSDNCRSSLNHSPNH
jgi:hypothetical protein